MSLPFVVPSDPIFRIARKPDPWKPIDWAHADDNRTFGNRFDDSEGYFRVLYAGSSRLGCFMETLARFRTSTTADTLSKTLAEIAGADSDHIAFRTVPASWFVTRSIGRALPRGGRYADIYSSEWLSHIRRDLERDTSLSSQFHLDDEQLDLAGLMSQARSLTQRAATIVSKLGFDGIVYQSRHGAELKNWALFEPFHLAGEERSGIDIHDQDFREAASRLDLLLDPTR